MASHPRPLPPAPRPPPGHTQYAREPRVGGGGARPAMPVGPPSMPSFPPPNVSQPNLPQALARRPAPERRGRYGAKVSDIRNENISEADARRLLSSYVIIRMQKKDCFNEVDEEGYALRPTWLRVETAEDTAISQQEATRKARELMKHGPPVGDKKSDLGPAVQRQIEKAHSDLEKEEPDSRYHYVLAQLDSKLRRIDNGLSEYRKKDWKSKKCKCMLPETRCKCVVVETRCRCTRVQTKCHCSPLGLKCKCSLVKTRCKCGLEKTSPAPKYERVSVTTYFKRTPKPNQSALAMLQEERSGQQSNVLVATSKPVPQPLQHYRPSPSEFMPPSQPSPDPRPPPRMDPSQPTPRLHAGNAVKGHHKPEKPGFVEGKTARADPKVYFESSRNTQGSLSSQDSESSDYETAASSSASSSRRSCDGIDRSRSRHRFRDRQEYFGLHVPRRHSRRDEEYSPAPGRAREHRVLGRRPLDPVTDSLTARDLAWVEYRNDEMGFPGSAPKVIQISSSLFRCMPDHAAQREIFADRLAQVEDHQYRNRLESEARFERDSRLEQDTRLNWRHGHVHRQQRLGERLRLNLVDNLGRVERHDRESARHREQPWQTGQDNPFVPLRRRSPY